jgi:hypothetical protein
MKKENPDNEEEYQANGQGIGQGNGAGDAQKTVPKARDKRKYQDTGTTTSLRKNMKSHKEPTIYTLMVDDIDKIEYQVRDVVEEETQQMS